MGDRVADFAQIVGRYIGGHAHGDAAGTVDQHIGQFARQHERLFQAVVEIRPPVDRIHFDVLEQHLGQLRQLGFGVAHGGRAVAVDRAEVPLPVHQRIAQAEILGHARQRVVNRLIVVRMVFAQYFTDDAGRFLVGGIGAQPHIVHRVEDAPVDRFQPVAGVGQGACNDDADRIVQERGAHLIFDGDFFDPLGEQAVAI